MKSTTHPEVFIIESLGFDDENEREEGRLISSMLALSGKKCRYYYIRTRHELSEVLKIFSESGYRYLHLSCHGSVNRRTLHTTLDPISFNELAPLLRPHLRNRRLFVSACSMANRFLGNRLMPESGCNSILGPQDTIYFRDAAILWASLYHVMFSADNSMMKHADLKKKAQEIADMFRVKLNYMPRNDHIEDTYDFVSIVPRTESKRKSAKK